MKRAKKIFKRVMITLLVICLLVVVAGYFYMQGPQFGALPKGDRLKRVEASAHFKDGKFRNRFEKPQIAEGYSLPGEAWSTLAKSFPRREPKDSIPSIKTNLFELPADSNLMVWMGHSSIYIQLNGIKILIDPVFSGKITPMPWGGKAYKGSDNYKAADMPAVDYILISHDHYDHVDYETLTALRTKVKHVICGLGVGAHLERWGYTAEQIIEKDWYEQVDIRPDFTIYTEPTHHASGRGFTQEKSLWMSYMIDAAGYKIYYSGDGGYDDRYAYIADKYGRIDWAIMENGQYNLAWQSVHNLPEGLARAIDELKPRNVMTVHHSKFTLAKHPWDEPFIKAYEHSQGKPYRLATPLIGEPVYLQNGEQTFKQWWVGVE